MIAQSKCGPLTLLNRTELMSFSEGEGDQPIRTKQGFLDINSGDFKQTQSDQQYYVLSGSGG